MRAGRKSSALPDEPTETASRLWQRLRTRSGTFHWATSTSTMIDEQEAMEHTLPKTNSSDESMVFITIHKAGSVFVNDVLNIVAEENGLIPVDFAGEAFREGVKEWQYCVDKSPLLRERGYYFGAFRGPYVDKFADLSQNRILMQVRDPRDCIVSLYYSYRFSHGAPGKGPLRKIFDRIRQSTQEKGIDEFALQQAASYAKRLQMISNVHDQNANRTLLVTYEEMVQDFDGWLDRILGFFGLRITEKTRRRLLETASFNVVHEDQQAHKRQVAPGDHLRKLTPETIRRMDEIMSVQLREYGYL